MRWCASVAAASLLMGGVAAAPATAAPLPTTAAVQAPAATTTSSKLTIGTIASPLVAVGGSAKVTPSIKLSGQTELSSATFTIKKGGKTVASKAKSASLKAGTYAVTTTATYRTYTVKDGKKTYSATKKSTKSQTLKVRTAVAIKKIASKTAPYGKKATIKPNVTVSKGAKLVSKSVTVKQGSKTLVTNKSAAALKAGKYSVTTTVKYKVPVTKTSTEKSTSKSTVAGPNRAIKMNCTVDRVGKAERAVFESEEDGSLIKADFVPVYLNCTGGFDGTYATEFLSFPQTALNDESGLTGFALWEDNWEDETPLQAKVGAKASPVLYPSKSLVKTVTTSKQVTKTTWSKTYTTSAKQSLTIKAGAKPSRVAGTGSFNCPKGYPVKGNADSGIYHVPGGAYYSRTKPEECFTTAAAAKNAGYRASKR
ncbi:hypothetical protein BJH93_07640 [Kocuria polaris]|nr:hypothetical protein [Kocuria polaris]